MVVVKILHLLSSFLLFQAFQAWQICQVILSFMGGCSWAFGGSCWPSYLQSPWNETQAFSLGWLLLVASAYVPGGHLLALVQWTIGLKLKPSGQDTLTSGLLVSWRTLTMSLGCTQQSASGPVTKAVSPLKSDRFPRQAADVPRKQQRVSSSWVVPSGRKQTHRWQSNFPKK